MQLASRFASRSPSLRSDYPLSDDQIHRVAPSIFAEAPHESRSQRYAYIPTATVLTELRKEGLPNGRTSSRCCAKRSAGHREPSRPGSDPAQPQHPAHADQPPRLAGAHHREP